MGISCLLGFHAWDGCICAKCSKTRDGEHDWSKDCEKCWKCGKTRECEHYWASDCEKCSNCEATRENKHNLTKNCNKCSTCGKVAETDRHDWKKDCKRCSKCGTTRKQEHDWKNGVTECTKCGRTRENQYELTEEETKNLEPICVSIRLAVRCETCNIMIPVNGITKAVKCYNCQKITQIKDELKWKEILNYQILRLMFLNLQKSKNTVSKKVEHGRVHSCVLCTRGHVARNVALSLINRTLKMH